jgi:uncharacterized protein (DUF2235 family)
MKLVVACDGTWNEPENQTHIHKICEAATALFKNGPDKVKYVKGVGTEAGRRFSGGALGKGLSANVREGYRFIAKDYKEGAEIYIFGFSRGAYTARSLAGFINFANLLMPEDLGILEEAYSAYRFRDRHERAAGFKQTGAYKRSRTGVKVRFLGVFDTVGALGVPFPLVERITSDLPDLNVNFHDVKICGNVEVACHALAVDEQRGPFRPTWWEKPDAGTGFKPPNRVRQVWFPGVHSDIGGGYKDDDGIANLSLNWMVNEAKMAGLDLRPGFRQVERDITPRAFGEIHDSMSIQSWILHLLPHIDRLIRPIGEQQRRACKDLDPYVDVMEEYVHWSLRDRMEGDAAQELKRLGQPAYRPKSLTDGDRFRLPDGVRILDDR